MEIHVFCIACSEETAEKAVDGSHPLMGTFFDSGTFAWVNCAVEDLLAESFFSVAQTAGLTIRTGTEELACPADIRVFATQPPEVYRREDWEEILGSGRAVSGVMTEASGSRRVLWFVTGYEIPSMGFAGECGRQDIWHTWIRLAGSSYDGGRYLLEEREETPTTAEDRLIERLRQLYGE